MEEIVSPVFEKRLSYRHLHHTSHKRVLLPLGCNTFFYRTMCDWRRVKCHCNSVFWERLQGMLKSINIGVQGGGCFTSHRRLWEGSQHSFSEGNCYAVGIDAGGCGKWCKQVWLSVEVHVMHIYCNAENNTYICILN